MADRNGGDRHRNQRDVPRRPSIPMPATLPVSRTSRLAEDLPRGRTKGSRIRQAFSRKVELMEKWATEGLPEGRPFPRTTGELRQWYEPELGAYPWGSPNTLSLGGPFTDLRERFERALVLLTARLAFQDSAGREEGVLDEVGPRQRGSAPAREGGEAIESRHGEMSLREMALVNRIEELTRERDDALADLEAANARIDRLRNIAKKFAREFVDPVGPDSEPGPRC